MNIVVSCDNNYAPYLAVNILSILKKTKSNINFYILDLGIEDDSRNRISEIVHENNCDITFILVDKSELACFPITLPHISIATYARLRLDYYLPNLDKVIYLDVDTLALNDLTPLWDIDLEDYAIGACIDSFIEFDLKGYKYKIGLTEKDIYFNAGVLLVNLVKFRELRVYENAISFLEKYPEIEYQDQDILNFLFKGCTKIISPIFNFMPTLRNRMKDRVELNKYEKLNCQLPVASCQLPVASCQLPVASCQLPVAIVHYCSSNKAWHKKCSHTKSSLFYSIFGEIKNKPLSWENRVEKVGILRDFSRKIKDIRNKFMYGIRY